MLIHATTSTHHAGSSELNPAGFGEVSCGIVFWSKFNGFSSSCDSGLTALPNIGLLATPRRHRLANCLDLADGLAETNGVNVGDSRLRPLLPDQSCCGTARHNRVDPTMKSIRFNRVWALTVGLVTASSFFFTANALAQQGTGGGGNVPATGGGGDFANQVPTTPTTNTGAANQSADLGGQGDILDLGDFISGFDIAPESEPIENLRVQPFAGASRERMAEQGLIHPRSQIEPSAGTQSGGGSTFSFGGGGRGGAAGGATNGFEVARGGIRTTLVSSIALNRPPRDSGSISSSFQNRLSRVPAARSFADNVQMAVQGKTAVLTGNVTTEAEKARAEQLARFEPGIYAIDNRIQVQPE